MRARAGHGAHRHRGEHQGRHERSGLGENRREPQRPEALDQSGPGETSHAQSITQSAEKFTRELADARRSAAGPSRSRTDRRRSRGRSRQSTGVDWRTTTVDRRTTTGSSHSRTPTHRPFAIRGRSTTVLGRPTAERCRSSTMHFGSEGRIMAIDGNAAPIEVGRAPIERRPPWIVGGRCTFGGEWMPIGARAPRIGGERLSSEGGDEAINGEESWIDCERRRVEQLERGLNAGQKPKSQRFRGSGSAIILWSPIGNSRICPVVRVCLRNGTSA